MGSLQCRINNSSKSNNCYGPRAFGGPAVLCVKYMQGLVLEFRCPKQTLRKGPCILHMLYKTFSQKASKIFHFVCECASALRSIHTVNYLKSLDFKLFFVYTLNLLRIPFWHIFTEILFYFDKYMTCFRAY